MSANSLDKPAKSLFKANDLAFSKLSSLPVNTSACNSAAIEDSKFNNEPAILSTCSKLEPNNLASVAASAINTGFLPSETAIASLTLATSLKTPLTFIATPFWLIRELTVSTVLDKISSVFLPWIRDSNVNLPASSAESPIGLLMLKK